MENKKIKEKKKILLVTFDWGKGDHPIYGFSEHADISAHSPNAAVAELSYAINTSIVKQTKKNEEEKEKVFDFSIHKSEYDILIVDSKCPHEFWMVALMYNIRMTLIHMLYKPNLVPKGALRLGGKVLVTYDDDDSWDHLAYLMHLPPTKTHAEKKACVLPGTH